MASIVGEHPSDNRFETSQDPVSGNAVEMNELRDTTTTAMAGDATAHIAAGGNDALAGQQTPLGIQSTSTEVHHSNPTPATDVQAPRSTNILADAAGPTRMPLSLDTTTQAVDTDTLLPDTTTTTSPRLARLDSVAIGPSHEHEGGTPMPLGDSGNPVCMITLLLTSGARHPYKLDDRYLRKRNVDVPGLTDGGKKDPFSISVYTLKELILREWRDEWEGRPSSPSYIRLIHFGRLLDDKTPLKECRFNADSPNVVHMTVKPQDIAEDDEATKGKSGSHGRDGGESTPGCRCVIM